MKLSGWLLVFFPPAGFSTWQGYFPPTDSRFFREMKHGVPRHPIRFGLITAAIRFKPGDDVGIQTQSYGFLLWPIELADFGPAPIENHRCVGKVNVLVSFCSDGADVSLLLLMSFLIGSPFVRLSHASRQAYSNKWFLRWSQAGLDVSSSFFISVLRINRNENGGNQDRRLE
jgi:hypothetical protein